MGSEIQDIQRVQSLASGRSTSSNRLNAETPDPLARPRASRGPSREARIERSASSRFPPHAPHMPRSTWRRCSMRRRKRCNSDLLGEKSDSYLISFSGSHLSVKNSQYDVFSVRIPSDRSQPGQPGFLRLMGHPSLKNTYLAGHVRQCLLHLYTCFNTKKVMPPS